MTPEEIISKAVRNVADKDGLARGTKISTFIIYPNSENEEYTYQVWNKLVASRLIEDNVKTISMPLKDFQEIF